MDSFQNCPEFCDKLFLYRLDFYSPYVNQEKIMAEIVINGQVHRGIWIKAFIRALTSK